MKTLLSLLRPRVALWLGLAGLALSQTGCAYPVVAEPSVAVQAHIGGPVYGSVGYGSGVYGPVVYGRPSVVVSPPPVWMSPAPRVVVAPPMVMPAPWPPRPYYRPGWGGEGHGHGHGHGWGNRGR